MNRPDTLLARRARGFSLVELMVAMVLGLVLTYAMLSVYLSSKQAFRRQEQLNSIQQNVRIAFEYLANDARLVGHLGCFTGRSSGFTNGLAANDLRTNFGLGIEGYEFSNSSAGAYTLTSNSPADVTVASNWLSNTLPPGAIQTIPVDTVAGAGQGLTPGSDVLVIRTVAASPVRLAANAAPGATTLTVETATGGKCSDGTTDRVAGFCANGYGLIAGCTSAHVFSLSGATPTAPTLNLSAALPTAGPPPTYSTAVAEVLPMQTIVYYVKRSSSGTTTSLYRRIFDGDSASVPDPGREQELIEGVENLQVRYGLDTTSTPDGVIDLVGTPPQPYVIANTVTDWSRVVAVRMSLLIRAASPIESDVTPPLSGRVNDVTVTYPTGTQKFDRRVFTTTVAVRNRIDYGIVTP